MTPEDFMSAMGRTVVEWDRINEELDTLKSRIECKSPNCERDGHGCHKGKVCGERVEDHTDHYNCSCDECCCQLCLFERGEVRVTKVLK